MPENLAQKETVAPSPLEKQAEKSLVEMNEKMGEFLGELDTLEKNAKNVDGEEGEKLREQLKDLRKEAMFSADWWAGNIYAFTELVVGDGINFPALDKIQEANKKETPEEMRERAKKELAENGITSEQARVYNPINDALHRGIQPTCYELYYKVVDFLPNLFSGRFLYSPTREDAWRIYLGIPQKNNTFEISEYKPEKTYEYCYKLTGFWKGLLFDRQSNGAKNNCKKAMSGLVKEIKESGGKCLSCDTVKSVMGGYSLLLSKDEKGSYIAYDDVWDLDVFPENNKGFFGKPFHIYDRLYYNPETYEPLLR